MTGQPQHDPEFLALSVRADVIQRLLREGLLHADMLHCNDPRSKRQLCHWLLSAAAEGRQQAR